VEDDFRYFVCLGAEILAAAMTVRGNLEGDFRTLVLPELHPI
jgi:hypothetical protein